MGKTLPGIIILIICIVWWKIFGEKLSGVTVAEVPYNVKCFFHEPNCEKGDIDGETMFRGLLFLIIGYIMPNNFLLIFLIIGLLTIGEPMFGRDARYIINPLVSITGYAIGSVIGQSACDYTKKYQIIN